MPSLTNEKNIQSLAITYDLYSRILKYSRENGLITSTYNHGHGVDRQYTINFCLQTTSKNVESKYYLKRGGRSPSKYSGVKKDMKNLNNDTPDFDKLCRNIARKYASQVKFINRYENGHLHEDPIQWGNANVSLAVLSLPNEEFLMLKRIIKFPFSNAYSPTSEDEVNLCKSLENNGWLKSSGKSAYKLTTKAKPLNA